MNFVDRSPPESAPNARDRRPIPRSIRKVVDLFHAGVCLALAGSIAGYAGPVDFRLDLFAHFRLTYAAALALGAGLAVACRQRWLALAWALGFCLNFAAILPLCLPPKSLKAQIRPSAPMRVQIVNVLRDNADKAAVIDAIRKADADVFVAVELDEAWLEALKSQLLGRWPHWLGQARGDAFGIALFSKKPLANSALFESPGSYAPSIRAEVDISGTIVAIYGTHPFPPVTRFNQGNWVKHMDDLARRIGGEAVPVVAIGDFNTTPWSENYRRFRKISGLVDSMTGFGPQASWPSFVPYAGLPIDHVMVSPGIRTIARKVGPFVGSDHYPVTADLEMPAR